MKARFLLLAAALLLGSESWPPAQTPAPLAGFSFSPETSTSAGRDPVQDLTLLLVETQPDLVRLPIYWEDVEPAPDMLDFAPVDALLKAIAHYDHSTHHNTRVVLTVGARNFLFPELHEPDWAGPREQPFLDEVQAGDAYRAYFDASIRRYRNSRLLYAWQVENEPLDQVGNDLTGTDQISASQLAWEVDEVHRLDPLHQAVVTTYNGLNVYVDMLDLYVPQALLGTTYNGHPQAALNSADALGLDMYVDGPNVPYRHLTTMYVREQWKQQLLSFWAGRASKQGKSLWLAEMQAQPWHDSDTFKPKDLLASAVDYRQEKLSVVLLWGVETWLDDPAWLAAGARALKILQS